MGIDSCLCGTGSQPLFKAVGRFNEMTANTGSTVLQVNMWMSSMNTFHPRS